MLDVPGFQKKISSPTLVNSKVLVLEVLVTAYVLVHHVGVYLLVFFAGITAVSPAICSFQRLFVDFGSALCFW